MLKLDPIITALCLIRGSKCWETLFYRHCLGSSIKFKINNNFSVNIEFDGCQKRIKIYFTSPPRQIYGVLQKKHSINTSSKNPYRTMYDFKYSTRNCDRAIKILTECFQFAEAP